MVGSLFKWLFFSRGNDLLIWQGNPKLMEFEEVLTFFENGLVGQIAYILLVLIITIIIASILSRALRRSYEKAISHNKEQKKAGRAVVPINKTRFNLLRRFLVSVVYFFGIILAASSIPALRELSYSLFAGAGILAIIIGFATQEVFSNIVAGVFISLFQPFRVDDRVSIGTERGFVDDITLWHTIIRTSNNHRLMIPNSIIAKEKIMNYSISDERTLNFIDFGISYDSNIDLARKIISEEVAKSSYLIDKKVTHRYLAKNDPFKVRVISHGDFSIGLRLYAWSEDATKGRLMKYELLENVKKRFDKEGVEIPFPYRTVVEKKDMPRNKQLRKTKRK